MDAISSKIRAIPDYPQKGVIFRDITTLLGDARGFRKAVDELVQAHAGVRIDKVAAIEARGFILGGAVAHQLSVGFVPIRKKDKLPFDRVSQNYQLEYGNDCIEVHVDAITAGDNVLLVDDLIATGGTMEAAVLLIRRVGGNVAGCSFIVDLPDLGGRALLEKMGLNIHTLCSFAGA